MSVGVVARSGDQGEPVAHELGARGLALPGDVIDAASCAGSIAALAASFVARTCS